MQVRALGDAHPHVITLGLDSNFGGSCASDLIDTLSSRSSSSLKRINLLEKAAKRYQAIHSAHLANLRGIAIAANKLKRASQQKSIGAMAKALKSSGSAPLIRVREGKGPNATIHTHPLEVDRVVRESMGEI